MSEPFTIRRRRHGERGQTILLVVVSLVALLGMAALAIDVVTLFVARAEVQRAADAAALAGAKAIADSGVTTNAGLVTLAQNMANDVISSPNGILQQNLVSGRPPALVGTPTFDFASHGNTNPTISVTLQQTNLPTFFARIWGRTMATVSATAMAEAYNPSGSNALVGQTVPIAPKCVKPWFLANKDPNNGGTPFIDPVSGAVATSNIPGASPFTMIYICPLGNLCVPPFPPLNAGQILPALVVAGNASGVPSCGSGATDYEQAITGCDMTPYACGGPTPNATIDTLDLNLEVVQPSLQCLIHSGGLGLGQGQDRIDTTGLPSSPPEIHAGSANALIGTGSPVVTDSVITTSPSVVTIPIIDTSPGAIVGNQVRVIGFVQGFLTQVLNVSIPPTNLGIAEITPLNISGCGKSLAGPPPGPISGGGVSPVPVRLIHQ
jgi:hypothetical protein